MSRSAPWFPFFARDWRSGVAGLSAAERGVYISLLACMYDHGGPIKRDDARLARECGLPIYGFRRALEALIGLSKITVEGDLLFNERAKSQLSELMVLSRRKAEGARLTNEKRLNKSMEELRSSERSSGRSADASRARVPQPQPQTEGTSVPSVRSVSESKDSSTLVETGVSTSERREKRKEQIELIQAVVSRWNDLAALHRLPEVRDITAPRQAAILARAADLTETYDYPEPLAGFGALFAKVSHSPFLRGETNVNGFRCDLDFCIRASSFTKIMEGKYEGGKKIRK